MEIMGLIWFSIECIGCTCAGWGIGWAIIKAWGIEEIEYDDWN